MVDLTKVEQRREEAIKKAKLSGDWDKVENLLNQSYENLCRKDRSHGLCSLDSSSIDKGSLLDTIADYNDPLSLLIKKEEIAIINDAIESLLSDKDREILFGVVFGNKSFSHLAKEVGLSDKTVKRHYDRIIERIKKNHNILRILLKFLLILEEVILNVVICNRHSVYLIKSRRFAFKSS